VLCTTGRLLCLNEAVHRSLCLRLSHYHHSRMQKIVCMRNCRAPASLHACCQFNYFHSPNLQVCRHFWHHGDKCTPLSCILAFSLVFHGVNLSNAAVSEKTLHIFDLYQTLNVVERLMARDVRCHLTDRLTDTRQLYTTT
jgi:hypothetical protein